MPSKPSKKISSNDKLDIDLIAFMSAAASDTLKELGPISKEEYDYYENL